MDTLKEKIVKEYAEFKTVRQSYGEIAKKLGCTKTYVYKVLKALNLNPASTAGLKDTKARKANGR